MTPQKLMEIRTTGAGMTRMIHEILCTQYLLDVFILNDRGKRDYNWISKEVEEMK